MFTKQRSKHLFGIIHCRSCLPLLKGVNNVGNYLKTLGECITAYATVPAKSSNVFYLEKQKTAMEVHVLTAQQHNIMDNPKILKIHGMVAGYPSR